MATARELLSALYEREGELTPTLVVEEARPETSPLHQYFEWNDDVAAEQYRRVQASHLIRSVKITFDGAGGQPRPIRGFLAVRDPEDETRSTYMPSPEAFNDPVTRRILLAQMRRDWKAFKQKYDTFQEFRELIREELS